MSSDKINEVEETTGVGTNVRRGSGHVESILSVSARPTFYLVTYNVYTQVYMKIQAYAYRMYSLGAGVLHVHLTISAILEEIPYPTLVINLIKLGL